jgi:hypothetical protein
MDVDCCGGGTFTFAPGDQFDFVNNQDQDVQVTNCNPPLPDLAYDVPAAQNGTPGRCSAQIADDAQDGTYTLSVSGCPAPPPPSAPIIKVAG